MESFDDWNPAGQSIGHFSETRVLVSQEPVERGFCSLVFRCNTEDLC